MQTNIKLRKGDKVKIVDFGRANSKYFTLNKVYILAKDLNDYNGFFVEEDDEGDINGGSNAFELGMKFEPINDFPEKWVIKQRLSKEVCDWWNKRFNKTSYTGGNYEYLTSFGGYRELIPEGYTEITLEQFNKYILNKEEKMKTYKVTREQMQEIYSIACHSWKTRIEKLTEEYLGMFNTEGELPEDVVQSMRDAATVDQLPVINKIFPEPKKLVKKEVKRIAILNKDGSFQTTSMDIIHAKAYHTDAIYVELTGTYEIEE